MARANTPEQTKSIIVRTTRRQLGRWHQALAIDAAAMGAPVIAQVVDAGDDEIDVSVAIAKWRHDDLLDAFDGDEVASVIEAELDSDAAVILARAADEREIAQLPVVDAAAEGEFVVRSHLTALAEAARAVRRSKDGLGGVRLAVMGRDGDEVTVAVWLPEALVKKARARNAKAIGGTSRNERVIYAIIDASAAEEEPASEATVRERRLPWRERPDDVPF